LVSYFSDILIHTLFGFAALYPLYFWFVPRENIDSGFYNFNLGLSGLIGGMALTLALAAGMVQPFLYGMSGWLALHLLVTFINWDKEKIVFLPILFSSLVGIIVFILLGFRMFSESNIIIVSFVGLLGQGILTGVIFAMILGHWYLNVIQLPISLLQNTTNFFGVLLGIRLLWDCVYLPSASVIDSYGKTISILHYMWTLDGFFLGVALFFGLCVPLVLHFFILRTLKLHATQSATGLLYISVLSILVGELCYKFVQFQDGLFG